MQGDVRARRQLPVPRPLHDRPAAAGHRVPVRAVCHLGRGVSPATRRRIRPRPDLQVRGGEAPSGGPPAPGAAGRESCSIRPTCTSCASSAKRRSGTIRACASGPIGCKQEELAIIQQVDCTIVHSTFEQALLARGTAARARRRSSGGRSTCRGRRRRSSPGATSPSSEATSIRRTSMARCSSLARSCRWCRQQLPDVRFHVVGSNPPAELLALQSESIRVTRFRARSWSAAGSACASASRRCAMAPGSRARSAPA